MASCSGMVPDQDDMKPPEPEKSCIKSEERKELSAVMDDLYTQQHFNMTEEELVDSIFNLSIEHLMAIIPGLKKSLMQLQTAGSSEEELVLASAKTDTGLTKYIEKFYASLERNTDVLQAYIQAYIINIPKDKVIPRDISQIRYKELVKVLQEQNTLSGDGNEEEYTEKNTADLLTKKAENMYKTLLEKKLERKKLECQIRQADSVLARIDSLETTVQTVFSEMPNLTDYVLGSVAAVVDLLGVSDVKSVNGEK